MDEAEALLQVTLNSPEFRKAGKRSDLLEYLVRHRNEFTSGETIWTECFDNHLDTYAGGQSVRERILDLKKALKSTFPPHTRGPRFELKDGVSGKGWRLTFIAGSIRCTEAFWKAHLEESREVIVVVNQPLFFRDEHKKIMLRCFGVDPERHLLPKMVLQYRRPDVFEEWLEAVQPYFISGEIAARDAITRFFSESGAVAVTAGISGRMTDDAITRSSLILIGDSGINRFIDSLESGMVGTVVTANIGWLEREDFLPYRLMKRSDTSPHGSARIYGASEAEKRIFPNGIVQETSTSRNERVAIYKLENDPRRFVYGVVTRMVNPYNDAPVTIISCLFSEAIEQMAKMLTDDASLMRLSAGLPWQSGVLPPVFQGLFAMRLGTPNLDAGALSPQMVCWRDLMADAKDSFAQSTEA